MRWIALISLFLAGCASQKVQVSYQPPHNVTISLTMESK